MGSIRRRCNLGFAEPIPTTRRPPRRCYKRGTGSRRAWPGTSHPCPRFCEPGRTDGAPCCYSSATGQKNTGRPVFQGAENPPFTQAGYGMVQLDPALKQQDLWSFRTNLNDWAPNSGRIGYTFWDSQIMQFNTYNRFKTKAEWVAPPKDITYNANGNTCAFSTGPVSATDGTISQSASFPYPSFADPTTTFCLGDAILMKSLAGNYCPYTITDPNTGANTKTSTGAAYISWNNKDPKATPSWRIVVESQWSGDIVHEFCSGVGRPRNCVPIAPSGNRPSGHGN